MSAAARVAAAVDGEAVVELVREATRIPSVTPHEEAFARWVWRRMDESEAFDTADLAECEPGRPNVCGAAGGGAGAPCCWPAISTRSPPTTGPSIGGAPTGRTPSAPT